MSEAGLNGFGDTIHSEKAELLTVKIGTQETSFALTTVPRLFTWEWEEACGGTAQIRLTFSFPGTLVLSFASLMPADNLGGWAR